VASLLGVLLVVAAFGLTVWRAWALEVQTRPGVWVVDAVPAALSELLFGHPKKYTVLATVRQRFFSRLNRENATARTINPAIRQVADMDRATVGDGYVLLGPDDKGIVDLIAVSFRLFGYRIESVTIAYFALLGLSCALYLAAFWRRPAALLLLASILGTLYLVMPMLVLNPQLRSVLALRALPILSMVACLHILLFMASSLRERVGPLGLVLAAAQVALIAFTMHLRSTTMWQVATILGCGVLVLLVGHMRRATLPQTARRSALVAVGASLGLVAAGYLTLAAYQATVFPEEYRRGDEIATRVFWHNIFSGFAYHPAMSERYALRVDDVSITAATRDYLAEIDRLDIWRDIGGEVPDFVGIKFATYDPVVRDMLIARCSAYPGECLETVAFYKPRSLMGSLAWLYGLRAEPPDLQVFESRYFGDIVKRQFLDLSQLLDERGQRAYLWSPLVLALLLPFAVLLLAESRGHLWAAVSAGVGLLLGSLIPTVAGYAALHTIGEPAIAVGMVAYLGLCVGLSVVLRRMVAARRA